MLQGSHPWSYHYGMIRSGRDIAKLEESGLFLVTTKDYVWVISVCVCVCIGERCLFMWVTVSKCVISHFTKCLCLHHCFLWKYQLLQARWDIIPHTQDPESYTRIMFLQGYLLKLGHFKDPFIGKFTLLSGLLQRWHCQPLGHSSKVHTGI